MRRLPGDTGKNVVLFFKTRTVFTIQITHRPYRFCHDMDPCRRAFFIYTSFYSSAFHQALHHLPYGDRHDRNPFLAPGFGEREDERPRPLAFFSFDSTGKEIMLFYFFDLAWTPGLVEPRLERAVKAQDSVPTLAGDGLDPIDLACRFLRRKVDIHGPVLIYDKIFVLAAHARELLICLDH